MDKAKPTRPTLAELEAALDYEKKRKKLMEKLRYVCSLRPSRRRNLFIFLCTLIPFLSYKMIDDFCRLLNYDREQTFAIADYLCSVQNCRDKIRGSRTYNRNRKDYLWMHKMELEIDFDRSDRHNERLFSEIEKLRDMISNIDSDRHKMNVEYPVLGKLLNLEPSSIACSVHSSRKLLSAVLGEGPQASHLTKEARSASDGKAVRLDLFRPFAVFGISRIDKEQVFADAS